MFARWPTAAWCTGCRGSFTSIMAVRNEQPSKSGLPNHSENTSNIASSCYRGFLPRPLAFRLQPLTRPQLLPAAQEIKDQVIF